MTEFSDINVELVNIKTEIEILNQNKINKINKAINDLEKKLGHIDIDTKLQAVMKAQITQLEILKSLLNK